MSRWIRLYTEVLDDPKVQRLPPVLFKHWVNLLCLAGKNDQGRLPDDLEELAFALRLPDGDAANAVLSALQELGLFEDDSEDYVVPHNWNGRQFKSDLSTERVKQFRKRPTKRDETVSVTPPETETETETETEKKEVIRAVGLPTRPSAASFEEFWKVYPRRDGANPKEPARKAFDVAVKSGTEPAAIVAAAGRYEAEMRGKGQIGTPYVAQAVTWLRQKRFGDYPEKTNGHDAAANLIHVMKETAEWPVWAARWHQHKGKDPPTDRDGGWYFPREWADLPSPPSTGQAA